MYDGYARRSDARKLPATPLELAVPAAPKPVEAETRHFVFLLLDSFTHVAFSCAVEPLRIANLVSGKPLYRWSLASQNGRSASSSLGFETCVGRGLQPLSKGDRLFVVSGLNVQRHTTPEILAFLRRERSHGRRIGAICSGAYVLAKAGFLDGVETAIHWEYHELFAEQFPKVRLRRSVFVADQPFVTASGGTAAADLMLHMIAAEQGSELATAVADQMVYNAVRAGSAEQKVSLQARHGMRNAHVMRAIRMMEANLETPLCPSEIADALGISTRQLERLFLRHLGRSPKRYSMDLRLDRARNLIVQTEQSVAEIAFACGFGSTSHFSKVFRERFAVSPVAHRTTLR